MDHLESTWQALLTISVLNTEIFLPSDDWERSQSQSRGLGALSQVIDKKRASALWSQMRLPAASVVAGHGKGDALRSEKKNTSYQEWPVHLCAMTGDGGQRFRNGWGVNLATERLSLLPKVDLTASKCWAAVAEAGYQKKKHSQTSDVTKRLQPELKHYEERNKNYWFFLLTACLCFYISMGSMVGLPLPSFLDHMARTLWSSFCHNFFDSACCVSWLSIRED